MSAERRVATRVGDLAVRMVESSPDRPTALLWHSLFVDSRTWSRVEGHLAGDRRLVLIDGPGHGRSSNPGRRYTMQECAEAATDVLAAVGVEEPVDWVGNAWGGHVGIVFAARWPERCRSLVTVGTPVQTYSMKGRLQTQALLLLYRLLGPARFVRDGVVDVLLAPGTRAHDAAALELVRDCFDNADRKGLANAVVSISLHREDLTPLLPTVQARTLLITGDHHADWPPEKAMSASRLLPHGAAAVLNGAAYLGPLEAPDAFSRLVREFWAAADRTSA